MNVAKWYACYACEASALFSLLGIFDGQHCTECPIEWSKENGKNRFACERGRGSLYKKWEEEEDILARKMYALQIAFLWK